MDLDRPADSGAPAQRASDEDRERAAERLRAAGADGRLTVDELEQRVTQALAARTIPELQTLLADLPETRPAGAPARSPATPGPESKWAIAIMGGSERNGAWRPAAEGYAVSVMGGNEIDFNDAQLVHPVTTLRVFSLMGGCDIRVPDNAVVHVSKLAIMGGHDVELGNAQAAPGAPEIHLQLLSIMGGTSVRRGRKRPKGRRKQRDQDQGALPDARTS